MDWRTAGKTSAKGRKVPVKVHAKEHHCKRARHGAYFWCSEVHLPSTPPPPQHPNTGYRGSSQFPRQHTKLSHTWHRLTTSYVIKFSKRFFAMCYDKKIWHKKIYVNLFYDPRDFSSLCCKLVGKNILFVWKTPSYVIDTRFFANIWFITGQILSLHFTLANLAIFFCTALVPKVPTTFFIYFIWRKQMFVLQEFGGILNSLKSITILLCGLFRIFKMFCLRHNFSLREKLFIIFNVKKVTNNKLIYIVACLLNPEKWLVSAQCFKNIWET